LFADCSEDYNGIFCSAGAAVKRQYLRATAVYLLQEIPSAFFIPSLTMIISAGQNRVKPL
jgi:hypothetical protein